MSRYDDIINRPYPFGSRHRPMPMEARAAQFAPFAALTGHDAAIAETARLTDAKPELSASELTALAQRLDQAIAVGATVAITWFEPDLLKPGGSYRRTESAIKKVDPIEGLIILADKRTIPLDSLISLDGDLFEP